MAVVYKPGSLHFGRTENDYKHILALREKYKLHVPPIEELKIACLADGYPIDKVNSLKYPKCENDNIEEILGRAKKGSDELLHEEVEDMEEDVEDVELVEEVGEPEVSDFFEV